jgi:HAE1 family hydrophobic/amphiphilic exporter-1
MERLRAVLGDVPGVQFSNQQFGTGGGAAASAVQGRPIQLSISGDVSLEELDALSRQALAEIQRTPGGGEADRSLKPGKPEVRLVVDRRRAADVGLNATVVGGAVRTLVDGDVPTTLREGTTETDIRVRLRPQDRERLGGVLSLTLPNPEGKAIPLNTVVQAQEVTGPTQVQRLNRERQVIIGADYKGRALGDVLRDITRAMEELGLPPGVQTAYLGQAKQAQEAFASLTFALLLAVIFVYMVLASQFGSFLHPFTIMLSLPLSFGGAFLALLAAHKPLDIMAMIGVIMLMGLVTKNAILLIDLILRLRRDGYTREQAILTAGPVRLRPILMTTAAMILGMSPSALALGAGAEFRSPMAITVIGGLITSTLLTLVVVPVVYTFLDDLQNFLGRHRRRGSPAELVPALFGDGAKLPQPKE